MNGLQVFGLEPGAHLFTEFAAFEHLAVIVFKPLVQRGLKHAGNGRVQQVSGFLHRRFQSGADPGVI